LQTDKNQNDIPKCKSYLLPLKVSILEANMSTISLVSQQFSANYNILLIKALQ